MPDTLILLTPCHYGLQRIMMMIEDRAAFTSCLAWLHYFRDMAYLRPIADRHIGQIPVFNYPHTVPHTTI